MGAELVVILDLWNYCIAPRMRVDKEKAEWMGSIGGRRLYGEHLRRRRTWSAFWFSVARLLTREV